MLQYKPTDGYFGDPIPFYWKGTYHVFYLKAPLEPKRNIADHTPYAHVSTQDFIHWTEHPMAISPSPGEADAISCWTGCIIENQGEFFLFYTGHDQGHPQRPQSICLATSKDLDNWQKCPDNPIFLPDTERFEADHWRDPFVFWSETEQCFLMSITTMTTDLSVWKGGALVVARSTNLRDWEIGEVFYQPGNHCCPECSDIFKINNYWYMVSSMFMKTCYRIGDSPLGPWRSPLINSFDGPMNYAGKSISDGQNRYIFGWIRTKQGCTDGGAWEWAGDMSLPRQIVQADDGILYVKLPEQFKQLQGPCLYDLVEKDDYEVKYGKWLKKDNQLITDNTLPYNEIVCPGSYPSFDMELEFKFRAGSRSAGIVFFQDGKNHAGYEVAIDLQHQLLAFRMHTERFHHYTHQDIEIRKEEPMHLRVIVNETMVEAFLNDKFALAGRFYQRPDNANVGLYVEDGNIEVQNFRIYELIQPENLLQKKDSMQEALV